MLDGQAGPTPGGPSVVLRISSTRELNLGSFSPSARKAKTSSMGRSIPMVASKQLVSWEANAENFTLQTSIFLGFLHPLAEPHGIAKRLVQ